MMEVVRRIHALCNAHDLPYCVIGGVAVIRNGHARTTIGVDVLTFRKDWLKALPLKGEIVSERLDICLDKKTGVRIDILFADEDWGMVIPMPDPRKIGEFDSSFGATFIGLHDLVQLKTAVYLDKLREHGPSTAAKGSCGCPRPDKERPREVFEASHRKLRSCRRKAMHGDLQGSCAGSEKWEKEAQGHRIVVTQRADWQPSLLRSTTSAPVSKSTSRCLFPPSTISSSVKCPLSRFPSSTLALCAMSRPTTPMLLP